MLSCFTGKRRRRRVKPSHSNKWSTSSSAHGSSRYATAAFEQHAAADSVVADATVAGGASHAKGAPSRDSSISSLQPQQNGKLLPPGLAATQTVPPEAPHTLALRVVTTTGHGHRSSDVSDASTDAAWIIGRRRKDLSDDGMSSAASFITAQSSFSSVVSAAPSGDSSEQPFRPSWSRRSLLGMANAGDDSDLSSHGVSPPDATDVAAAAVAAAAAEAQSSIQAAPVSQLMRQSLSWQRGRADGGANDSSSDGASDAGSSAVGVLQLIREAEVAYSEGRLLAVRNCLQQAAALQGCSFRELLADGLAAILPGGQSCDLPLAQLQTELELIQKSLSDAQDYSGYTCSRDDELRVMYRHVKGSGVHSFRFEATYDCPLSHMLAITREFDLLGTWNRMALDPIILSEPSMFTNIVYTGQWMPFPLSELDLVVRTQWSDLLEEEQALLITMSDFSRGVPAPGITRLPLKSAKRRRIQLLAGSSSILQPMPCTADGQQRTRCAVLAHLNPHVSHVPGFLISFVLKVLSPFIYNATKELLDSAFDSPDSELPKRMAASSELYGRVDDKFRSPPHGSPPPPPIGRCLTTSFRGL